MSDKGHIHIDPENAAVYTQTMELRWLVPNRISSGASKLQQAWRGSDGSVIWEDVPMIPEEE